MKKRALAFLLIFGLLLQCVPFAAVAAEYPELILSDDCSDLASVGYVDGTNLSHDMNGQVVPGPNVSITQGDDSYLFKTIHKELQGILSKRYYIQPLNYTGGPAELSMNVKVNDLPVIATNYRTWRGFGAELRAYDKLASSYEQLKVMLSATADGRVLFVVVNTSSGNEGVSIESDYKIEDQPVLDITLTKKSNNTFTLTVNGEILGDNISAAKLPNPLGKSYVELYNCYYNFDKDYGVVDVELNSLLVTAEQLEEPSASRNVALNAYMADPAPALDGAVSDLGYNFQGLMTYTTGSAAPANAATAVQWDGEYLYFGVKYTGTATAYEATLNGETVSYDFAGDSFGPTLGAEATQGQGSLELKIPYSAFNIHEFNFNDVFGNVSFKLMNGADSAEMKGSLKLLGAKLIWEESFENFSLKGWSYLTGYITGNSADAFAITQKYDDNGGYLRVRTRDYAINAIVGLRHLLPAYDNGYLTIDFNAKFDDLPIVATNQGWRGFGIEVRTATVNNRFNFTKDAQGNIFVDILGGDRLATGLVVGDGETHNIRLSADKNTMDISLYVDGNRAGVFTKKLSTYGQSTPDSVPRIELFLVNYDRPSASEAGGGCSLEISDLYAYRPDYITPSTLLDTLLSDVSWDSIRGENASSDRITSDILLGNAGSVTLPFIGAELPIAWSSSNPDAISNTGELLYTGAENLWVTLTASVSYMNETRSRQFTVQIPGHVENGSVSMLQNDLNPYTGAFETWTVNTDVIIDKDRTSIGYDLGSVQRINRVLLTDGDDVSRLKEENLSLYVSDDNVTYRKVSDWSFIRIGAAHYLYNFDVEARYVKVHSHFDSLERFVQTSFLSPLQSSISAYYSTELIGAGGGTFTKTKNVSLRNTSGQALEDYAAYLPLQDLAIGPDCKPDLSDVRFLQGERLLYHYYDGSGFYVRIPYAAAGGSIELKAVYGNALAEDISTGEGVFEAVYGRVNLFQTKVDGTSSGFSGEHKVRTMPNGDIIAIGSYTFHQGTASEYAALVLRRSTDGGRTWGEPVQISEPPEKGYLSGGGFLVDPVTDRVFYFGFNYVRFSGTSMSQSDCRMYYIYSDDNGETWSEVHLINNPERPYSLSYCNAIATSGYDGGGPNVDFVLTYSFQADNTGSFAVSALYSADAGETWQISDSVIRMKAEGFEGGVSESALVELQNGVLYTVMRAQTEHNDFFYASYSYDNGITWDEEATPSNILTTNTMPVFDRYDGDLLLLWQGNNTMGGHSYKRFPLNVAYSKNDGAVWERILDLSLGTSLQIPAEIRLTQSDIDFTTYMGERDAVLVWCNMEGGVETAATAMLVEEFDRYLYKTQGAFDSFEISNARNEGWVQIATPFSYEVSSEQAAEGNQSMKLTSGGGSEMVSRNIPSMKNGAIAYSVFLPESFSATLHTEFKAAYNTTLKKDAPIYFYINAAGQLCSKAVGNPVQIHATLTKGQWHELEVVFDLSGQRAVLYVDGVPKGSLPVQPGAQLATVALTLEQGTSVYIDSFRATASDKYASLISMATSGDSTGELPATQTPPASKPVLAGEFSLMRLDATSPDDVVYYLNEAGEAVPVPFSLAGDGGIRFFGKPGVQYFAKPNPKAFSDAEGHWAQSSILAVASREIFQGYPDNSFRPNAQMTRGMFAAVLARMAMADAGKYAAGSFRDVAPDAWYGPAISWASQNGIVTGRDGLFDPDANITREELATMLSRFIDYLGIPLEETNPAPFTDMSQAGSWAADAIVSVQRLGLMQGREGNRFDPSAYSTRGEIATILLRLIQSVTAAG